MSNDEDYISNLKVDNDEPDMSSMYMVNSLFNIKNIPEVKKTASGLKDIIIVGILFAIFSIPFVDNIITNILHLTKPSTVPCIAVKVLLFITLIFFFQNFSLAFA